MSNVKSIGTEKVERWLLVTYIVEASILFLLLIGNLLISIATTGSVMLAWGFWLASAALLAALPILVVLNQRAEANGKESVRKLAFLRRLVGFSLICLGLTFSGTIPELVDKFYTDQGYNGDNFSNAPLPQGMAVALVFSLFYTLGFFLLFVGRGKLMSAVSGLKFVAAIVLTVPLIVASLIIDFSQSYRF